MLVTYVAHIVGWIPRLGLEIALGKSEASYFNTPRRATPPNRHRRCQGSGEEEHEAPQILLAQSEEFLQQFYLVGPETIEDSGSLCALFVQRHGSSSSRPRLHTGVTKSIETNSQPTELCLAATGAKDDGYQGHCHQCDCLEEVA